MILNPYIPCSGPQQSGGATQIPSLTELTSSFKFSGLAIVSGVSDSGNPPDSSSKGSSHEMFSLSSAISNKAFSFVVMSQLICSATLAFRRHSGATFVTRPRQDTNTLCFSLPTTMAGPYHRIGNKCRPRVGSVFLDFAPNKNQFTSHNNLGVCELA